MENNTISMIADLESGDELPYLRDATPAEAIQKYLAHHNGPPVQQLVITAKTNDGKLVSLSITQTKIMVSLL